MRHPDRGAVAVPSQRLGDIGHDDGVPWKLPHPSSEILAEPVGIIGAQNNRKAIHSGENQHCREQDSHDQSGERRELDRGGELPERQHREEQHERRERNEEPLAFEFAHGEESHPEQRRGDGEDEERADAGRDFSPGTGPEEHGGSPCQGRDGRQRGEQVLVQSPPCLGDEFPQMISNNPDERRGNVSGSALIVEAPFDAVSRQPAHLVEEDRSVQANERKHAGGLIVADREQPQRDGPASESQQGVFRKSRPIQDVSRKKTRENQRESVEADPLGEADEQADQEPFALKVLAHQNPDDDQNQEREQGFAETRDGVDQRMGVQERQQTGDESDQAGIAATGSRRASDNEEHQNG